MVGGRVGGWLAWCSLLKPFPNCGCAAEMLAESRDNFRNSPKTTHYDRFEKSK
jgi:hypothetical protein